MKLVTQLAREVLEMEKEIHLLRAEVVRLREYEQKYHDEIRAGIEHGEKMMVGWLDLLMSGQVKMDMPKN